MRRDVFWPRKSCNRRGVRVFRPSSLLVARPSDCTLCCSSVVNHVHILSRSFGGAAAAADRHRRTLFDSCCPPDAPSRRQVRRPPDGRAFHVRNTAMKVCGNVPGENLGEILEEVDLFRRKKGQQQDGRRI